jgi:putative ABC transport system permease protein
MRNGYCFSDVRLRMNGLFLDFHYAGRRLLSTPGFTIAVTLILGLGIGANAALFTALDRRSFGLCRM